MGLPWTVLERRDLLRVLSAEVMSRADGNVTDEAAAGGAAPEVDPDQDTRSELALAAAVQQFRDTVRSAGRFPLSVTAGAVPAEAVTHVLNLAAYSLVNSTPNVPMVVVEGQPTFQRFFDEACKYLDAIRKGATVAEPDDPTGADYLTAVSTENPAVSAVRWSDLNGTKEEYAQGYITTSTGALVSLPLDDMRTF